MKFKLRDLKTLSSIFTFPLFSDVVLLGVEWIVVFALTCDRMNKLSLLFHLLAVV